MRMSTTTLEVSIIIKTPSPRLYAREHYKSLITIKTVLSSVYAREQDGVFQKTITNFDHERTLRPRSSIQSRSTTNVWAFCNTEY